MVTTRQRPRTERALRVADVSARAEVMLAGPPGPDLAGANLLAIALCALADEAHDELADCTGLTTADVRELGAELATLTGLADRLRTWVVASRFVTLERIHEGLSRMRELPTTAQLIPQAAEELARCCDFDRALVSAVRGTSWRAEAVWMRPDQDPGLARRITAFLTSGWRPLESGVLETELVRRRVAVLVTGAAKPAGENLMTVSESPGYVAAPIVTDKRVIGFLHADCLRGNRVLTSLDRDNIASFAEGFGLVFERTALLERLERQRLRVHEAFAAVDRELAGPDAAETVLVRRDREAVAGVRMAAGLRKISMSSVDQLLTLRERQVVELMVLGRRNRQIADELVIAEETVKSHVRSISRKLHASSRADAVSRYLTLRMREGL